MVIVMVIDDNDDLYIQYLLWKEENHILAKQFHKD